METDPRFEVEYHDNELAKQMKRLGDQALQWAEQLELGPHHAIFFIIFTIALKWYLHVRKCKAATRPPGPSFVLPLIGETLEYIRRPSAFVYERCAPFC